MPLKVNRTKYAKRPRQVTLAVLRLAVQLVTVSLLLGSCDTGTAPDDRDCSGDLQITPSQLPGGIAGISYEVLLTAVGGVGVYSWSVVDGGLPNGLSLSSGGDLTGTPLESGSFTFTIQVACDCGTATSQLTLTVGAGLAFAGSVQLPSAVVGENYSESLAAVGGTGAYTWSLLFGDLPDGLSLTDDGILSGIPSGAGEFSFAIAVTDGAQTASGPFQLCVRDVLTIVTSSSLPPGTVDAEYGVQLEAQGGDRSYSWALVGGTLPSALSLDPNGRLGGTLLASGNSVFELEVTSGNQSKTAEFTLSVVTWETAPATPFLSLAVSGSSVQASWADVSGETEYRLERQVNGGDWVQIAVLAPGTTSHVDTEVKQAEVCGYRIQACNTSGCSGWSNLQLVTVPLLGEVCRNGRDMVVVLVDPRLSDQVEQGIGQFSRDICADGHTAIVRVSDFSTPLEVRAYLQELHEASDEKLVGTILIGDLPYAYQYVTLQESEEVISFQFYADLDGTFDSSPAYHSPGGHPYSYDIHGGNVDWEVWVGVLPLYQGSISASVAAINEYFAKNHSYRTEGSSLPRSFLLVSEHFSIPTNGRHQDIMNNLCCGVYSWTPFSNSSSSHIFFDSPPVSMSVAQGYAALSNGIADFFVGEAHGGSEGHGQLNVDWVESQPVRTSFFWSDACGVGNLDHTGNFLTALLYSPTSMVLFAKGATGAAGGMGTNMEGYFGHNIAVRLSQGMSIGNAIVGHVNVPLAYPWAESREFHFATQVFLGDPTLRVRP